MSNPWTCSTHAALRMNEMGVPMDEILAAVNEPSLTYPCAKRYPGRSVAVGGRLAVVVAPASNTIVTVLWAGAEGREFMSQSR